MEKVLLLAAVLLTALVIWEKIKDFREMKAELYGEPEEDPDEEPEDEPDNEWSAEVEADHTASDNVSPLVPWIVTRKKYLRYVEDLTAYKKAYAKLVNRLAHCEGAYYLKDSQQWGTGYTAKCMSEAQAVADAVKWQRMYEDLLEQYDALMNRLRSAENKGNFTKELGSGKFQSADGVSKKEKSKKAYFMKKAGYDSKQIAEDLGCAVSSVASYISKGKSYWATEKVKVMNDDTGEWTSVPGTDIDEYGFSSTHPDLFIDDEDYSSIFIEQDLKIKTA